jgi:hypothetical protein
MHDLFNPAGLSMLEDRQGAIAYGHVAHRVFYSRFVGHVVGELAHDYVRQLERVSRGAASFAFFVDASALREYDSSARACFAQFVLEWRAKLTSLTILTVAGCSGEASCALSAAVGEPVDILADPLEFERLLCNVAPPLSQRALPEWAQVWQVHAPR